MGRKRGHSDAGLFYIDEASLATTDEDECLNLYETGIKPEEIADPGFRETYRKFLDDNGYTFDD